MADSAHDPQGIAAERRRLTQRAANLATAISAYSVGVTGDLQGLRDLQLQAASVDDRLNGLTTSNQNLLGTSLSGTVLDGTSTT